MKPECYSGQQPAACLAAFTRVMTFPLMMLATAAAVVNLQGAGAASQQLTLEAQYAISASLGRAQAIYHARKTQSGFRVENRCQRLTARFTSRGAEVVSGNHLWGLGLIRWGRGLSLHPLAAAEVRAAGNRIEYDREP